MVCKLVAFVWVAFSGLVTAADILSCAGEPDDRLRLVCYDKIYKPSDWGGEKAVTNALINHQRASIDRPREPSVMTESWELDRNNKRHTFLLRTHQPNFLLPLHYTSNINRAPHSPTQQTGAVNNSYRNIEAKLQISLRTKVVENLFLPGADLWVAYTQRSLWQPWGFEDSSPFRTTDYQPELIFVVPVSEQDGNFPLGWTLRMLQFGFVHQSNGQSDPLSRSWNRFVASAGFEQGNLGVQISSSQRVRMQGKDDNPDIADYIGRAEVSLTWSSGAPLLSFIWRTNLNSVSRGSIQLDWNYPVFANQPKGLRWYAQLFHGYGETLLDYNHRQSSLGLGLAIFQF